ncbi:hypothetical protein [Deinococcus arcticus]|uniref:hypothetical protein n=1 Tax=Deinococcus arcticus TaxID=2136176 RepID=UPI0011B21D78|nr:hypothetical protein [Deinococcus arcticus]
MRRLPFLAATFLLTAAAGDQVWVGRGETVLGNVAVIDEGLRNRLHEFGLTQEIGPVSPAYALTSPELNNNPLWRTPYMLRVYRSGGAAGYNFSFGPQKDCPDLGNIDCTLGTLQVSLSSKPLTRKPITSVPVYGGLTVNLDGSSLWWRFRKANYDLFLLRSTPLQQLVLVNAALVASRDMLPSTRVFNFSGTIGSTRIRALNVRLTANEAWGSYLYASAKSSDARLYLYGSLQGNQLILNEYDLSKRTPRPWTGTFKGTLSTNGTFSGQWAASTGKILPFRLTPLK